MAIQYPLMMKLALTARSQVWKNLRRSAVSKAKAMPLIRLPEEQQR
jgi:hypothetical protein